MPGFLEWLTDACEVRVGPACRDKGDDWRYAATFVRIAPDEVEMIGVKAPPTAEDLHDLYGVLWAHGFRWVSFVRHGQRRCRKIPAHIASRGGVMDEKFQVEIEVGGRVTITKADGSPFCEHTPGRFTFHGVDRGQLLALEQANSVAVGGLQAALMTLAQDAGTK